MTTVISPNFAQTGDPAGGEVPTERDVFMAFLSDEKSRGVLADVCGRTLLPIEGIRTGNIKSATAFFAARRSPEILVVDIDGSEDPVGDLARLGDVCELGTRLVVVGSRDEVGLFRDIIQSGGLDYVVKPLPAELMLRDLTVDPEDTARSRGKRRGKTIAVIGSRGGIGATTLTAWLGRTAAEMRRRRTALIDLDPFFGDLGVGFDIQGRPGLLDALQRPERLDPLFVERVMVRHGERLHLLASEEAFGSASVARPEGIDSLTGMLQGTFHYVIADLPRHPWAPVIRLLQLSSTVLVVTDLSATGVSETARLLSALQDLAPNALVIVAANMVGNPAYPTAGGRDFEKALGRRLDVSIPFDTGLCGRIVMGEGAVRARKREATRSLAKLSDLVLGPQPAEIRTGWFSWLKRSA